MSVLYLVLLRVISQCRNSQVQGLIALTFLAFVFDSLDEFLIFFANFAEGMVRPFGKNGMLASSMVKTAAKGEQDLPALGNVPIAEERADPELICNRLQGVGRYLKPTARTGILSRGGLHDSRPFLLQGV